MTSFELVFALFGLLLGLGIAELLGGFSRAVKLKRGARPVRIGWLTPLLGLFIMLDLTSFWLVAYDARDHLLAEYPHLIAVLAIVGIYYLAATLVFPDDPAEWPDFDDWYDRHNRIVLGGMLVANLAATAGEIGFEIASPTPVEELPSQAALVATFFGAVAMLLLLIALIVIRNRHLNVALMAVLIVLLVLTGSARAVL